MHFRGILCYSGKTKNVKNNHDLKKLMKIFEK